MRKDGFRIYIKEDGAEKKYNFVNERNGVKCYRSRDRRVIAVYPDGTYKEIDISKEWGRL